MSRQQPSAKRESRRTWLSGLAVILTGMVCLFGFWRLSPVTTWVVVAVAFVALIVLFWIEGGKKTGS